MLQYLTYSGKYKVNCIKAYVITTASGDLYDILVVFAQNGHTNDEQILNMPVPQNKPTICTL